MTAQKVLITGLNGFTAPHVAVQFLNNGWTVRGTVRSTTKKEAVLKLPTLAKWANQGKLEVVIVEDFLTSDWTEALKGVDAVVLVATPFDMTLTTYEAFARPAIEGTKRVLEAAAKASSIKAIGYVSSATTLMDYFHPLSSYGGRVVTKDDWLSWTEEDASKEGFASPQWYCISKKCTELAARETKEKTGAAWALSTYVPPGIYGPVEQVDDVKAFTTQFGSDLSTTSLYTALCSGEDTPLPYDANAQYVRDLAAAIYSGITKQATGRYITAGDQITWQKFVNIARKLRPDLSKFIPKGNLRGAEAVPEGAYTYDTSSSQVELGINYRSLEDTVRDTIARFEELGVYKAK
uniref:NAD-dependent epimerase/dehydratase domain-containing protein n=1 Tax=Kwoniella bestiolae CBS 10118 TaxID=1296100 RepID=A0A1B9G4W3_9TREE|nr:hypothetical protein I302_03715 [Kwoniella bestiolae CBS 10118]OCF26038.1 hypothetical protein I302_03715 [Kwoniella bestiolae CBS 10118]